MSTIAENYAAVMERIEKMARLCRRNPDSVRLVVVTKGHPPEAVQEVLRAGASDLGENYVEEALAKMDALAGAGHPADGRPGAGHPADGRPEDGRPEAGHPADGRPEDGRPGAGHPADGRPADGRPEAGHPADERPEAGHPADGRPDAGRPEAGRPVWHMIGHVQSRKAAEVATRFDRLHSLDSLRLAQRLERGAAQAGRILPALLECNVSGEESKFGWSAWDERAWPALADSLAPLLDLPHLRLQGLMTMAPFGDDPEAARPTFRRLAALRDFLAPRLPGTDLSQLSMGMSGDFETAITEGATLVRIGTAILGPRRPLTP